MVGRQPAQHGAVVALRAGAGEAGARRDQTLQRGEGVELAVAIIGSDDAASQRSASRAACATRTCSRTNARHALRSTRPLDRHVPEHLVGAEPHPVEREAQRFQRPAQGQPARKLRLGEGLAPRFGEAREVEADDDHVGLGARDHLGEEVLVERRLTEDHERRDERAAPARRAGIERALQAIRHGNARRIARARRRARARGADPRSRALRGGARRSPSRRGPRAAGSRRRDPGRRAAPRRRARIRAPFPARRRDRARGRPRVSNRLARDHALVRRLEPEARAQRVEDARRSPSSSGFW